MTGRGYPLVAGKSVNHLTYPPSQSLVACITRASIFNSSIACRTRRQRRFSSPWEIRDSIRSLGEIIGVSIQCGTKLRMSTNRPARNSSMLPLRIGITYSSYSAKSVAERLAQPFSMSFQVGRGCLPLIITRQRLSDTRRHLSLWLGPRRRHESAWCLLGFAGGNGFNHADRAGFRHVFSDPRCLFSRYPRLHDTLIQQRVSSASRRLALAVELLCSAQIPIDLAPAWLRPLSALPSIDLPRSRKVLRE